MEMYYRERKDGTGLMNSKRIVYQDWIVDLGHEPGNPASGRAVFPAERLFESIESLAESLIGSQTDQSNNSHQERIIEAVNEAVSQMGEQEREFVVLYYVMGRNCRQIAEDSGRAMYKLEALHTRVVKQLRTLLADFVSEEFGIKVDRTNTCLICNSPFRAEIDQLLSLKKEDETWRESIKVIKESYQIRIKTPQTLIGHIKFHH